MGHYSIGIDFGTEEARAMLVDMEGNCHTESSFRYPHGVMTSETNPQLISHKDYALQDPKDYIDALDYMFSDLKERDEEAFSKVVGIGIDFTQCTMVAVDSDWVPLCFQKRFSEEPMAYVKLWKHHGAWTQAQKLTAGIKRIKPEILDCCGGEIYAETMFPKMLETFEKAPLVYKEAAAFVELADWTAFYLTGEKNRSVSIAGCAALWNPKDGYPSEEVLEAVEKGFGKAADEKLKGNLIPVGKAFGRLRPEKAERFGLKAGIPVAAGLGDCQAGFIGAGLHEEKTMLSVMGTSSCDMIIDRKGIGIPGMYGVSFGSIFPDKYGYEAGQATMGDLFKWFSENCVPQSYFDEAEKRGETIFDYLNLLAESREPGDSGLLALDWWNGNRSVLLDTDLSGLILGLTMTTRCEDIYIALTEALAFGKRRIIEQFESYGINIKKIYATGGVANKNPYLMQKTADISGIPIYVSRAENGSCTGSAIYGALAAGKKNGGYDDINEAAEKMGSKPDKIYVPNQGVKGIYDEIYREYKNLYEYFGTVNHVMKRLKRMKGRV